MMRGRRAKLADEIQMENLMRLNFIAAATGLALIVSSAAFAQDTMSSNAPEATAQTAALTSPADKVTCRMTIHQGALTGAAECHTQAVWDQHRHIAEDQWRNLQNANPVYLHPH